MICGIQLSHAPAHTADRDSVLMSSPTLFEDPFSYIAGLRSGISLCEVLLIYVHLCCLIVIQFNSFDVFYSFLSILIKVDSFLFILINVDSV